MSRCEIVEDFVLTPVCVNVTDQEMDRKCETVLPDPTKPPPTLAPQTCFKKECKNVDTTKLVKECQPVSYEECDIKIEEIIKTECKNFTTNSTEQVCEDKKEHKCKQDFVYVCEEKLPHYGYGHDHGHHHPPPAVTTVAPPLYYGSTTPHYQHQPEVLPPVRVAKYGEKWKVKRDAADIKRDAKADPEADPTLWPTHPALDHPFKDLKKNHYGHGGYGHHYSTTPPPPPPPPPVECQYKPTKKCGYVTKQVCEPKNTTKSEEVCVEIPTQKAEKVCKEKMRMECEVIEKPDRRTECDVTEADPPPPPEGPPPPKPFEKCDFVPRPVQREVCKEVKMKAFTERCMEIPVPKPTVDCGTQMMPLSLKDICVKIDFRLPRQECRLESREDCR